MTLQRDTLLCRYYYDPQDRIAGCSPLNQDSVQRFYRKDRLTTEIQGQGRHSVFEHEAQILAQQQSHAGKFDCALLATDLQRSVLHLVSSDRHQQPVYSPYGHRFPESGPISLLGFNGQRRDPVTGHYLLGNGYRAFNPVLMRFNSPDNLSPFGKGGVNAYAYCAGDPVNRVDPTGHHFGVAVLSSFSGVQRVFKNISTGASTASTLVNNLGQSARSMVSRAVGMIGGARPNSVKWGDISQDIQAYKKLRDARFAHSQAVTAYTETERLYMSARSVADSTLKRLEQLKLNPGTNAPVGSTAYNELLNKPTMEAFQAHRKVEALQEQLMFASNDAFRADLKFQTAQVIANVRRGD